MQESGLDTMGPVEKNALKADIKAGLDNKIALAASAPRFHIWKWIRIPVAAAILMAAAVGAYYALQLDGPRQSSQQPAANNTVNIPPGGNHAVLTMGDNSVVKLDEQSEGVFAREDGAVIRKNKNGEITYTHDGTASTGVFNTITTPRGGQYRLILADGTKVWLNAASWLKFPAVFQGANRSVEVYGEVYFEVAKDMKRPFVVKSRNQEVEVLGTHFNMNTYEDEPFDKTTLLEGSIKISSLGADGHVHATQILTPSQIAAIEKGSSSIRVTAADVEEAVAWKNGYFKFHKTDLKSFMRQVSRWYNLEVVYQGNFDQDLFSGKINRTDSVSGVLKILQLSNINAMIKGRTIIISN
ncbi:FecR domain-containing protein [Chitinophaga pollutisoli]|uniref:FecR domain-containing protein n=1 Tax=Chitinophaga pollutisoli TaxID=3133966 RepID=A0ABZ2YV00_9BACT